MTDQAPLFTEQEKEEFLLHAAVALLWSTTHGEDGNLDDNHGVEDLHPNTRAGLAAGCQDFMNANAEDLIEAQDTFGYSLEQAGHDFILSRNGHGAGFFDRGLEELGDRLQKAAESAGPAEAYLGDDGKIYISGMERYGEPEPEAAKPRRPKP